MTQEDYNALLDKFEKMPDSEKVSVLKCAIDLMQSYNGRSRSDCIVIALGGDYVQ